jgi:hypothetical protein
MIKFFAQIDETCNQCQEEIPIGAVAYRHDKYDDDIICEYCYLQYLKETI